MTGHEERVLELYRNLSNFANGDRVYGKLVGEAMIHDHPLLQSYVIGIMLDCIKAMAENDHITPQNEHQLSCVNRFKRLWVIIHSICEGK